jgi:O-antigen ligase
LRLKTSSWHREAMVERSTQRIESRPSFGWRIGGEAGASTAIRRPILDTVG